MDIWEKTKYTDRNYHLHQKKYQIYPFLPLVSHLVHGHLHILKIHH